MIGSGELGLSGYSVTRYHIRADANTHIREFVSRGLSCSDQSRKYKWPVYRRHLSSILGRPHSIHISLWRKNTVCVILFYFSKLKLYGHLNCGHNIDVKSPTIAQPSANWVLTYFDFSHFTSFHTKTTSICLIDLPLRRYRTPSCSLISEEQSHFGGAVVFRRSSLISEE